MSSFICDPHHIALIAVEGARNNLTIGSVGGIKETAAYDLARVLAQVNIDVISEEYRDGICPGPNMRPEKIVKEAGRLANIYQYQTNGLPVVAMLKLLDCFEYQIETGEQTPTMTFVGSLRCALITQLPGYEQADWQFSPKESPDKITELLRAAPKIANIFKDYSSIPTKSNQSYLIGFVAGMLEMGHITQEDSDILLIFSGREPAYIRAILEGL